MSSPEILQLWFCCNLICGPNLPLFFHRLTWTWHLEEWKDGFKIYVSRFRASAGWCTWCRGGVWTVLCLCLHGRTATPKSSKAKSNRTSPLWREAGVAAWAGGLIAGTTLKAPSQDAPMTTEQHGLTDGTSCAQVSKHQAINWALSNTRAVIILEGRRSVRDFAHLFGLHRPMWLLGSPSQVMMMDERLSPSARSVQSPGNNSSTGHSIDAILGFKEDTLFHKSASYSMTEKVKDAERNGNVIVAPVKKSHYSDNFDSE